MSLKPSSRFAAKGTKKAQAQRTDSLTDNDDIIVKQPWTVKREDLAVDIPDYSKECAEPLVIRKKPLITWFDNICYYNGNTLEKRSYGNNATNAVSLLGDGPKSFSGQMQG